MLVVAKLLAFPVTSQMLRRSHDICSKTVV